MQDRPGNNIIDKKPRTKTKRRIRQNKTLKCIPRWHAALIISTTVDQKGRERWNEPTKPNGRGALRENQQLAKMLEEVSSSFMEDCGRNRGAQRIQMINSGTPKWRGKERWMVGGEGGRRGFGSRYGSRYSRRSWVFEFHKSP